MMFADDNCRKFFSLQLLLLLLAALPTRGLQGIIIIKDYYNVALGPPAALCLANTLITQQLELQGHNIAKARYSS